MIIDENSDIVNSLKVCHWNARSLKNKSLILADYVISHDVDIMLLTETWLSDEDDTIIKEITPPGYVIL